MSNQTTHNKQAAAHPSSHGEDEVCEGGRSGYPSDLQTALQKLRVTHSEDRDQTEELFDWIPRWRCFHGERHRRRKTVSQQYTH